MYDFKGWKFSNHVDKLVFIWCGSFYYLSLNCSWNIRLNILGFLCWHYDEVWPYYVVFLMFPWLELNLRNVFISITMFCKCDFKLRFVLKHLSSHCLFGFVTRLACCNVHWVF